MKISGERWQAVTVRLQRVSDTSRNKVEEMILLELCVLTGPDFLVGLSKFWKCKIL